MLKTMNPEKIVLNKSTNNPVADAPAVPVVLNPIKLVISEKARPTKTIVKVTATLASEKMKLEKISNIEDPIALIVPLSN